MAQTAEDKAYYKEVFNGLNFERSRLFSIIIMIIGLGLAIVDYFISDVSNPVFLGIHLSHWYVFAVSLAVFIVTTIKSMRKYGTLISIIFGSCILLNGVVLSGIFDAILNRGITVYLFSVMAVGALLFFRYYVSVILVSVSLLLFVICIVNFQPDFNQLSGDLINSSSFSLIALFLFVSTRKRKSTELKQNRIIVRQQENLEHTNEILVNQNTEIQAQKEELTAQRDTILDQNREITDSIEYARNIQSALVPSPELFSKVFRDYFILYRPREIVSGDFYFLTCINDWTVIAVADCTGHGVPGALMSMLGISFLNEIVRRKEIINAGDVLNELRIMLGDCLYFQQTDYTGREKASASKDFIRDGIEISLAAINQKSMICHWAGAHNPLMIVPASANETNVQEIRGDRYTVAVTESPVPFTDHVLNLGAGDKLYMFTDGFQDQFGGQEGKKFYSGPFKKLIADTVNLSMADQKQILENAIDNWMNGIGEVYEQIDDITVIGFAI